MFVTHSYPPNLNSALVELNAKFLNYPAEEFSDHRLYHALRNAYWYYKDHWVSDQSAIAKEGNTGKLMYMDFLEFSLKMVSVNPHFHQYIERMRDILDTEEKNDRKIPRGKTVLFDGQCKHFVAIQPYKRNYVVLPGGKMNEGESMLACAIRETREEIGYDSADILTELNVFKYENTQYFYGKGVPSDGSVEFVPESSKEVKRVVWVKVNSLHQDSVFTVTKDGEKIDLRLPDKVMQQIISVARKLRSKGRP